MSIKPHFFNLQVSLFPAPSPDTSCLIKVRAFKLVMAGMGMPNWELITEKEVYYDPDAVVGGYATEFKFPLVNGIPIDHTIPLLMTASANGYSTEDDQEWGQNGLFRVAVAPDGMLAIGLVSLEQVVGLQQYKKKQTKRRPNPKTVTKSKPKSKGGKRA